MLFDWIIAPILSALSSLFSALPSGGLNLTSLTYWTSVDLSAWVHQAASWLPMSFIVPVLVFVCGAIMPAFLVYALAQWAYRELPHIFGWGS